MHEPIAGLVPVLGRALLHFLWQGALIGLMAAVALQLLRDARPQARYAVACLALLACVLAPLATLLLELAGGSGASASQSTLPTFAATATAVAASPLAWASGAPLSATLPVERLLPWIVAGWAAGACALSLRLAAGVWWLGRMPGVQAPHLQRRWQRRLDALALASGLRRAVALRLVDVLDTPAAAGWWRPVVLLPVSLLARMPADYIEALLAHELAHVRRHDYLVNLLQGLAEALLFYHPVTWWLSRRIHAERELVADRLASDATGEPRRLALALAELADHQAALRANAHATPQPALAALAPEGGPLMSRIEHLVRPGRARNSGRLVFPLLGLAAAGLAFYAHAERQPHVVASVSSSATTPAARGPAVAAVPKTVAAPKAVTAPAAAATPQAAQQVAPVAPAAAAHPAGIAPMAPRGTPSSVPAPPAPPAPPATPAAPASSVPPAPPTPPAPPAKPSLARVSGAAGGEAYALVRKGSEAYMISGSSSDHTQIDAVRRTIDGDFVWFRRDGKTYVVTDPATVSSMGKSWAEADALGERMQAIGQEMEGHGRRMEAIGREMEQVAGDASPPAGIEAAAQRIETLSRQQAGLAARQAQLSLAMADADDARRADLERQMQGLERESEALSAKIDAQSRQLDAEARSHEQRLQPMDALARKMDEASRPMDALARQMDGLGRQMEQVSQHAEGETRRLIAEALDKGLARPLPQRQ